MFQRRTRLVSVVQGLLLWLLVVTVYAAKEPIHECPPENEAITTTKAATSTDPARTSIDRVFPNECTLGQTIDISSSPAIESSSTTLVKYTIRGQSPENKAKVYGPESQRHLKYVRSPGNTIFLTISLTNLELTMGEEMSGGGIEISGLSGNNVGEVELKLHYIIFRNLHSHTDGGALHAYGGKAKVALMQCEFINCQSGGHGGAIASHKEDCKSFWNIDTCLFCTLFLLEKKFGAYF